MSDLINEYRPSMDIDVLHSWAQDAIEEMKQLQQRIVELELQVRSVSLSRDELASTVERLRLPMIEFIRKCDAGEARSKRSYSEMKAAIEETPQQNLANRDAEVARKGYLAGIADRSCEYMDTQQVESSANEYADRVKRGEWEN